MFYQLRAVGEVAVPDLGQRVGSNQIDGFLPCLQQLGVTREALECFT